jgi:hypothetical protein
MVFKYRSVCPSLLRSFALSYLVHAVLEANHSWHIVVDDGDASRVQFPQLACRGCRQLDVKVLVLFVLVVVDDRNLVHSRRGGREGRRVRKRGEG